jgi:hypothetical protein
MSDYWDRRDDDRRWDDARYDRDLARRDEAEAGAEGRRALRRGDTAWAINAIAGPDLALSYLDGVSPGFAPGEAGPGSWPEYQFPDDVGQFRANVDQLVEQGIIMLLCRIDGNLATFEAYGGRIPDHWFIGSCSLPVSLVRDYVGRVTLGGPSAYEEFVIGEFRRAGG